MNAALRELHEETALVPERLYYQQREPWLVRSVGYDARIHVFVALVQSPLVVINGEHSEYRWCSPATARGLLPAGPHRQCFDLIEADFILREPPFDQAVALR